MRIKNCLACGKPATLWTGHIHTEIGIISCGWCDAHLYARSERPRSSSCTSINPSSCYGEYKLSEIELAEELNAENLLKHAEQQEFSRQVDMGVGGEHRNRKPWWKIY